MAAANGTQTRKRVGTVEKIKQQNALKERKVDVPEWGCAVVLREFSKAAWRQLREDAKGDDGHDDPDRAERLMVVRGIVEPQFSEEDVEELWEGSSDGVDRVLGEILDMNGLTEEVVAAAARLFRASG